MKRYYNLKRSKGLDLKEGDKMWLLYKNFKNRQLSKKLDYVKLGLFKIYKKVTEVIYKLDLLKKNVNLPNIIYYNIRISIRGTQTTNI